MLPFPSTSLQLTHFRLLVFFVHLVVPLLSAKTQKQKERLQGSKWLVNLLGRKKHEVFIQLIHVSGCCLQSLATDYRKGYVSYISECVGSSSAEGIVVTLFTVEGREILMWRKLSSCIYTASYPGKDE